MPQIGKFNGWFDQLINTGIKILPGLLTGGSSGPKAPTGCMVSQLKDSGQVSACIDQLSIALDSIVASAGLVDPSQLLTQAGAIKAAVFDSRYFAQDSHNENLAYLHDAQNVFTIKYNKLAQQLQQITGVPVTSTDPLTGQLVTTVPTASAPAAELIAGIPNIYLIGGAAAITALLLLKK